MRRVRFAWTFAAVLVAIEAVLGAQTSPAQKASFEVASIKPNKSGSTSTSTGFQACRFVANNATLQMMVLFTYRLPNGQNIPPDRLIGGPSWINTDRFDVEAKRDDLPGSIALDDFLLMVRSLLEDRFQLKVHWEKRDWPVYDLVTAKSGPKLIASGIPVPALAERNPIVQCSRFTGPPPLPAQRGGQRGAPSSPRGPLAIEYEPPSGMAITGTGVTISTLVSVLQGSVDRPIINKTGLNGTFDFKLRFSRERLGTQQSPNVADTSLPGASDPTGPSIFTAIQELGLKLESARAPMDVLVIDSVQRPSEN